MKRLIFSFLITLMSFQSNAQDIFDNLIDHVLDNLDETETTPENFVRHDSVLNKLVLSINAVCRVRLTNGQQVEGLIELAGGGQSNGFYFAGAESKDWRFNTFMKLSLYFERLERQSGYRYLWFKDRRILNWPVTKDTVRITNALSLQYLDWSGSFRFGTPDKKDLKESDRGLTLSFQKTSKIEEKYFIRDSLIIFQDLGPDTYLRKSVCPTVKVKLSDVESFELVAKPDKKWLAVIRENRLRCDREFKASGKSGFNHKTNWYHTIIKNTNLTQFIQKCLDLTSDISGDFGKN